jgi:methylmalonyl-CoA/ethylmalonyl-CoA epimerase
MAVLNCIHHINFIVADIAIAVEAYQRTLGLGPFEFEELPERGVATARARIGDAWIVLVSPYDENSIAGRHLKNHGEGFFLMSFGVDNLDRALTELAQRGATPINTSVRSGILGWRVADLETEDRLGISFHLTQVE